MIRWLRMAQMAQTQMAQTSRLKLNQAVEVELCQRNSFPLLKTMLTAALTKFKTLTLQKEQSHQFKIFDENSQQKSAKHVKRQALQVL